MRIFEKSNPEATCHICGKPLGGQATLITITGTEKDGIHEAVAVHVDCIELMLFKNDEIEMIYQVLKP